METHAVEVSRDGLLLQDSDCKIPSEFHERHKQTLSALKSATRNEYIHSGLYSSFTINSLQHPTEYKVIKTESMQEEDEPQEDGEDEEEEEKAEVKSPVEEVRTVIRFVTNKTDKEITRPVISLPSTSESAAASAFLASSLSAKGSSHRSSNTSVSSSPRSSRSPSLSPNISFPNEHRSVFLDYPDTNEPLNLSAGSKTKLSHHPPKAKKPRGLEICSPPLLLSSSDIGSIALNSPALPSGSLTPAFFTAQVKRWLVKKNRIK